MDFILLFKHNFFDTADQQGGSKLRPMYTTLTLYRLKLSLSSQDTKGCAPVGIVPTFTKKETVSDEERWLGNSLTIFT